MIDLDAIEWPALAGTGEESLASCVTCRVDKALKGRIYRVRPGRRDEEKRVVDVQGPITLVLPRATDLMPMRNGVGFERVRFDDDPSFADAFDVYAVHPERGRLLLDRGLRALLIEMAEGGEARAFFRGNRRSSSRRTRCCASLLPTIGRSTTMRARRWKPSDRC